METILMHGKGLKTPGAYDGKLQINEGMLYENIIAQMLVANGHKLYFYTHYNEEKHRNDMEIDFIISNNSKLKYKMFPIEVKSGKKYSTKSLNNFIKKYKMRIGKSEKTFHYFLCRQRNGGGMEVS